MNTFLGEKASYLELCVKPVSTVIWTFAIHIFFFFFFLNTLLILF